MMRDAASLNRRWRPALISFFSRRLRNHSEAEDLTQEVLARLLGNDVGAGASDGYVFQIAANLLRDRSRRMKVRFDYQQSVGELDGSGIEYLDPFRIAAGRSELAALKSAILDLPERTRTIFILCRLENVEKAAVAERFGISNSAVTKHLVKAMAILSARRKEAR